MTSDQALCDRIEFSRFVTQIMLVSTKTIERALCPGCPDLQALDVRNYVSTVRSQLDMIEAVIVIGPKP